MSDVETLYLVVDAASPFPMSAGPVGIYPSMEVVEKVLKNWPPQYDVYEIPAMVVKRAELQDFTAAYNWRERDSARRRADHAAKKAGHG